MKALVARIWGEVQLWPAGRNAAITEFWLAEGPSMAHATTASPRAFIAKSGPDASGPKSWGGFHFPVERRSAVQMPVESVHTAVANPLAVMCTAGKTRVGWRAADTGATCPQLPPAGLERDQS